MKRILIGLAFLGLFTFFAPNVSISTPVPVTPDCYTIIISCPDGSQHSVIVCEWNDFKSWYQIFCELNPQG